MKTSLPSSPKEIDCPRLGWVEVRLGGAFILEAVKDKKMSVFCQQEAQDRRPVSHRR